MHSLEGNKIAAAILTAGIIAMVTGIIASVLVHPTELKKNVYEVAISAPAAGGNEAAKPEGPQPIAKLVAAADVKKGEEISHKCQTCHTFENGGPNKIGPNLFGIVGEGIAQGKNGYQFSDALKKHQGSKWDVENLNHWLWKPQSFAKGTKMTFVGLPKAQDRADIVAYLETLK